MMKDKKIIIWDADGVLFHTFDPDGAFIWSKDIYNDLGISETVLCDIFSGRWSEALIGEISEKEHIQSVFIKHDLSIDPDVFIEYWLLKDRNMNDRLFSVLNRFNSYIGTNQTFLRTQMITDLLKDSVLRVYASSEIGFAKPDLGFFRYIEKDLDVPACELCLIDDTWENVKAVRDYGWKSIHYKGTDTVLAQLEEMIRYD